MPDIPELLKQRAKTHGDFSTHAEISQHLQWIIRNNKNYSTLSDTQKEALSMILHKVARIINGDPNEPDHWRDISGYATLELNILTAPTFKSEPLVKTDDPASY